MIEIITPAESTRLTTLDAVKADLGITGGASDDALGTLIDQFSDTIAAWCGRTFGIATMRETLDITRLCDRGVVLLERWPIVSVDSVSVAGISYAGHLYYVSRENGSLRMRGAVSGFTLWPVGETVVTYRTGYLLPGESDRTLPHDIERACILMVRGAWHSMGRDPLLRSEETTGVASFSYFAAGATAVPLEAQALLSPYQLPAVA